MARDQVSAAGRLGQDGLAHATFAALGRFLSPGDLLVVNTSGYAGRRGRRPAAPAACGWWCTSLPSSITAAGWLSCALAGGRGPPGRVTDAAAGGERITLPCAGRRWCWRAAKRGYRGPGWAGPRLAAEAATARSIPGRARPPDQLRSTCTGPGRAGTTRRCRPRPGQRRDAQCRAAVQHRFWSPAWSLAGIVIAPITLHTGVSSLEARELPLARAVHGARVPTAETGQR